MTTQIDSFLGEGQSIDTPPLFNGINYTHWKIRMRIFIQSQNYYLWKIIINDLHTLSQTFNEKDLAQLNADAMNLLYCALDRNEFNCISSCMTAKEIWNMLEDKYECTNKSETSCVEGEQYHIENPCLVAQEVHAETESNFTFDELHDAFSDLYLEYKKLICKNKNLKIENQILIDEKLKLTSKTEILIKENQELNQRDQLLTESHDKLKKNNELLSEDNRRLTKEVDRLKPVVERFTLSSEKLNLMINDQGAEFDKVTLGYQPWYTQKPFKNMFVKTVFNYSKTDSHKQKLSKISSVVPKSIHYKFNEPKREKQKIKSFPTTHVRSKFVKFNKRIQKYIPCNPKICKFMDKIAIKRIWVPKGTIIANLQGPKRAWVPKLKI